MGKINEEKEFQGHGQLEIRGLNTVVVGAERKGA